MLYRAFNKEANDSGKQLCKDRYLVAEDLEWVSETLDLNDEWLSDLALSEEAVGQRRHSLTDDTVTFLRKRRY